MYTNIINPDSIVLIMLNKNTRYYRDGWRKGGEVVFFRK